MDVEHAPNQDAGSNPAPARPKPLAPGAKELTPEMFELVEKLAHPGSDPYGAARDLGFYCEQCG